MEGALARAAWFIVGAIIIAYLSYLIAASFVGAQAAGLNMPIAIRDDLQPNKHQLSGMVMVPSPCDELTLKTEQISETMYELNFTTWREPSVTCADDSTPRAFRTVLFAPSAGVNFVATLDNVALPIAVIPEIATTSQ